MYRRRGIFFISSGCDLEKGVEGYKVRERAPSEIASFYIYCKPDERQGRELFVLEKVKCLGVERGRRVYCVLGKKEVAERLFPPTPASSFACFEGDAA